MHPTRRISALLAGIGLTLLGCQSSSGASAHAGSDAPAIRLAILPFENTGDTAAKYLVDGTTDAVRGKLTALTGVNIIGAASSAHYAKSSLSPQQIGQELGARFLVIGTMHPAGATGNPIPLTVQATLIDLNASQSKKTLDVPTGDALAVQDALVSQVTHALPITVSSDDQRALAARPTKSVAAYQAYLRGRSWSVRGISPAVVRPAIAAYKEALASDSLFALAWARLGTEYSVLHDQKTTTKVLDDSADKATARALALAPDLVDVRAARASFYTIVRVDNAKALEEAQAGLAHVPNSVTLLRRASVAEEEMGRWDSSAAHAAQAATLDPRDEPAATHLCEVQLWRRHYVEAKPACANALALRPEDLSDREANVMVAVAQGDLPGARKIILAAPPAVDHDRLLAYLSTYWDLYWVLDTAQMSHLLTLGPDAFDGDNATRAIVFAEVYALRGDKAQTRTWAEKAKVGFEQQIAAAPDDDQRHLFLGLSLAYLGDKAGAVKEGQRGTALVPLSKDARTAVYNQYLLSRIYLVVGEQRQAMDVLESLLDMPFYVSSAWLTIDPTWSSIRDYPRFRQLASAR